MKSVRQRILEAIEADFRAVDLPDWPLKFSTVELGPLADTDQRKRYSIGIVAGPEKERHTFPYIECNFTVGVEFRVTVNRNDDRPALIAEEVLTVIKRVLNNNRSWGGLAVDTKRTGNEIDMTTYGDRSVVGVCFCEVMFRHSHLDPRNENPDI